MDPVMLIVLIVIALAVGAGVMWFAMRQRRTAGLRHQFGPEYDRAVDHFGDPARAEAELEVREQRVKHLNIRPLSTSEQQRFAEAWRTTQARFVDDPAVAIGEADTLVADVMHARGYPVGDFEQQAADVSVDHPNVVQHYRAAHRIAQSAHGASTPTEDLRQAMVHYRALFNDLLDDRQPSEPHAVAAQSQAQYRRIA